MIEIIRLIARTFLRTPRRGHLLHVQPRIISLGQVGAKSTILWPPIGRGYRVAQERRACPEEEKWPLGILIGQPYGTSKNMRLIWLLPTTSEFMRHGIATVLPIKKPEHHMNRRICSLWISISAASLLWATGCSTTHEAPKQETGTDSGQIPHRAYNPATRSPDRPWPYGPESSAQ